MSTGFYFSKQFSDYKSPSSSVDFSGNYFGQIKGARVSKLNTLLFEKDFFLKNKECALLIGAFKANQLFESLIQSYIETCKSYLIPSMKISAEEFVEKFSPSVGIKIKGGTATKLFAGDKIAEDTDLDSAILFDQFPPIDRTHKNLKTFYKSVAIRAISQLLKSYPEAATCYRPESFLENFVVFQNGSLCLISFANIDFALPIPHSVKKRESTFLHESLSITLPFLESRLQRSEMYQMGAEFPVNLSQLIDIFQKKIIVIPNPKALEYNGFERLIYSVSKGWTILDRASVQELLNELSYSGRGLELFYRMIEKKELGPTCALNLFINAYSTISLMQPDHLIVEEMRKAFVKDEWLRMFPDYVQVFAKAGCGLEGLINYKILRSHLSYSEGDQNSLRPHLDSLRRVAGVDNTKLGYVIVPSVDFRTCLELYGELKPITTEFSAAEGDLEISNLLIQYNHRLLSQNFIQDLEKRELKENFDRLIDAFIEMPKKVQSLHMYDKLQKFILENEDFFADKLAIGPFLKEVFINARLKPFSALIYKFFIQKYKIELYPGLDALIANVSLCDEFIVLLLSYVENFEEIERAKFLHLLERMMSFHPQLITINHLKKMASKCPEILLRELSKQHLLNLSFVDKAGFAEVIHLLIENPENKKDWIAILIANPLVLQNLMILKDYSIIKHCFDFDASCINYFSIPEQTAFFATDALYDEYFLEKLKTIPSIFIEDAQAIEWFPWDRMIQKEEFCAFLIALFQSKDPLETRFLTICFQQEFMIEEWQDKRSIILQNLFENKEILTHTASIWLNFFLKKPMNEKELRFVLFAADQLNLIDELDFSIFQRILEAESIKLINLTKTGSALTYYESLLSKSISHPKKQMLPDVWMKESLKRILVCHDFEAILQFEPEVSQQELHLQKVIEKFTSLERPLQLRELKLLDPLVKKNPSLISAIWDQVELFAPEEDVFFSLYQLLPVDLCERFFIQYVRNSRECPFLKQWLQDASKTKKFKPEIPFLFCLAEQLIHKKSFSLAHSILKDLPMNPKWKIQSVNHFFDLIRAIPKIDLPPFMEIFVNNFDGLSSERQVALIMEPYFRDEAKEKRLIEVFENDLSKLALMNSLLECYGKTSIFKDQPLLARDLNFLLCKVLIESSIDPREKFRFITLYLELARKGFISVSSESLDMFICNLEALSKMIEPIYEAVKCSKLTLDPISSVQFGSKVYDLYLGESKKLKPKADLFLYFLDKAIENISPEEGINYYSIAEFFEKICVAKLLTEDKKADYVLKILNMLIKNDFHELLINFLNPEMVDWILTSKHKKLHKFDLFSVICKAIESASIHILSEFELTKIFELIEKLMLISPDKERLITILLANHEDKRWGDNLKLLIQNLVERNSTMALSIMKIIIQKDGVDFTFLEFLHKSFLSLLDGTDDIELVVGFSGKIIKTASEGLLSIDSTATIQEVNTLLIWLQKSIAQTTEGEKIRSAHILVRILVEKLTMCLKDDLSLINIIEKELSWFLSGAIPKSCIEGVMDLLPLKFEEWIAMGAVDNLNCVQRCIIKANLKLNADFSHFIWSKLMQIISLEAISEEQIQILKAITPLCLNFSVEIEDKELISIILRTSEIVLANRKEHISQELERIIFILRNVQLIVKKTEHGEFLSVLQSHVSSCFEQLSEKLSGGFDPDLIESIDKKHLLDLIQFVDPVLLDYNLVAERLFMKLVQIIHDRELEPNEFDQCFIWLQAGCKKLIDIEMHESLKGVVVFFMKNMIDEFLRIKASKSLKAHAVCLEMMNLMTNSRTLMREEVSFTREDLLHCFYSAAESTKQSINGLEAILQSEALLNEIQVLSFQLKKMTTNPFFIPFHNQLSYIQFYFEKIIFDSHLMKKIDHFPKKDVLFLLNNLIERSTFQLRNIRIDDACDNFKLAVNNVIVCKSILEEAEFDSYIQKTVNLGIEIMNISLCKEGLSDIDKIKTIHSLLKNFNKLIILMSSGNPFLGRSREVDEFCMSTIMHLMNKDLFLSKKAEISMMLKELFTMYSLTTYPDFFYQILLYLGYVKEAVDVDMILTLIHQKLPSKLFDSFYEKILVETKNLFRDRISVGDEPVCLLMSEIYDPRIFQIKGLEKLLNSGVNLPAELSGDYLKKIVSFVEMFQFDLLSERSRLQIHLAILKFLDSNVWNAEDIIIAIDRLVTVYVEQGQVKLYRGLIDWIHSKAKPSTVWKLVEQNSRLKRE